MTDLKKLFDEAVAEDLLKPAPEVPPTKKRRMSGKVAHLVSDRRGG